LLEIGVLVVQIKMKNLVYKLGCGTAHNEEEHREPEQVTLIDLKLRYQNAQTYLAQVLHKVPKPLMHDIEKALETYRKASDVYYEAVARRKK